MATLADRVVMRLREAGARHLFGVPGGGGNLDLIDAGRRAGLPFVLTGTETAAAIAAIAQTEITQSPAACLTTLGPGAASVVNGVACAHLDRAPLVVFTDSHPPSADGCLHQRIDHRALVAGITKRSDALTTEQTIVSALAAAMGEPRGPVHLDCSLPLTVDERGDGSVRLQPDQPACVDDDLDAIVPLSRARRPILIVGLGARRPGDAAAIRSLCERRGVPALVTYKAKGVVPDTRPWFAGVFTNGLLEQALVRQADLIVGIGLDPVELIPKPWTYSAPVLSLARSRMDDRQVPFAAQVVGDVPAIVDRLAEQLADSAWESSAVSDCAATQRDRVFASSRGFTADRVIAAAGGAASRARVTVDAGAHMFPATLLWTAAAPSDFLISNGLSTMGFALPAAIGAALTDPTRPVVAITGDGGLLMCLSELATAARERLSIVTLVLADARLSLIDVKQQRRRLAEDGVAIGAVCWPSIAEGFGVAGFSATNDAELDRALEGALAHRGPSLIEARIDPANYGAVLDAVRGGL